MKNLSVTVILIIALTAFAYFGTRNFHKAHKARNHKICVENLADIEGAKDQYAIEHEGMSVSFIEELVPQYLDDVPQCPSGGSYTPGDLQVLVTCDVEGHVLDW